MSKEINKKELMTLQAGTKIVCSVNPFDSKELVPNKEYTFKKYNSSNVPVNNYSATMTWYPDKPIWTPEQYEDIRFNFMEIEVEELDKPQPLKFFNTKD